MKDILLELERDSEMIEILEQLTEEERDLLLTEVGSIIDTFSRSLAKMSSKLDSSDAVVDFFDNLEKAISMSDIEENVGVEVLKWPEKH